MAMSVIGKTVGPYQIGAKLGEGGMGEVYRARDAKLNRDVALKILPDSFAADPERLARFRREAQVLASLNHPNIAAIHGLEDTGGVHALVLELVEGPTLAEAIETRTQGSLTEVLNVARQIANAVEAAHEQGVIHRDLKPANIKVRADGTVKVLDFGLAKALDPAAGTGSMPADLATLTSPAATVRGVILGTAAYMAPEQAKGKPVDKRADIWAFGVVLYEMLAGRRAFDGEGVTDVLAAVLRQEVDWTALPADTPPAIRRLLGRCLERDPQRRLRDVGDARLEIEDALAGHSAAAPPPASRPGTPRLAWAVAAGATLVAVAAIGLLAVWTRRAPAPETSVAFKVAPPEPFTATFASAISPDGQTLAFVAVSTDGRRQLWTRRMAATMPQPVPGTEGAAYPFWSHDGRAIAFFTQTQLKRVPVSGGPAQVLTDATNVSGGTWNAEDVILFGSAGRIHRIAAAGGTATPITGADQRALRPSFLPDGRHFVFTGARSREEPRFSIFVGELGSTEIKPVVTDTEPPALFAPPGYLLWVRDNTLMAQRFDASSQTVSGEPEAIATGVGTGQNISVSASGVLTYRSAPAQASRLTWFDRRGAQLSEEAVDGFIQAPNLSRDGKRIVYERRDPTGAVDLWMLDLTRGTNMRLTVERGTRPFFSPDGSQILFGKQDGTVYVKSSSGTGAETRLESGEPTDWSPDGRHALFIRGGDLWALPLVGDRKPFVIANGQGNDRRGRFSPDGRFVAYESNESGRFEVYVQRFPPTPERWQVSANGGDSATWRADGRELYFDSPDLRIMVVEIGPPGAFVASPPKPLFSVPGLIANGRFVVTLDGSRFLIPLQRIEQGDEGLPVTVRTNWTTLLSRR